MPTTASDARRELALLLRRISPFPPKADREVDRRIVEDVVARVITIERRVGRLVAPELRPANSAVARLCAAARRALDDDERAPLVAAIAGFWLPRRAARHAEAIATAVIALRASALAGLREIAATGAFVAARTRVARSRRALGAVAMSDVVFELERLTRRAGRACRAGRADPQGVPEDALPLADEADGIASRGTASRLRHSSANASSVCGRALVDGGRLRHA